MGNRTSNSRKNSRMKVFLVNNRPYRESRIYAVPCAIFVKSDMLPPETYDGNCRLPKVRIKNKENRKSAIIWNCKQAEETVLLGSSGVWGWKELAHMHFIENWNQQSKKDKLKRAFQKGKKRFAMQT